MLFRSSKSVLLEPGGAKAWYRLGQACLEVDDLGEARRAFQRLLELQPALFHSFPGLILHLYIYQFFVSIHLLMEFLLASMSWLLQ